MILLALVALGIVFVLRDTTTVFSALVSFAAAIFLWGCLEVAHFSGLLVGPRTQSCPTNVSQWVRFRCALSAMFYREVAVVLVGVTLFVITHGWENKLAFYTYAVLGIMRISTELNIFFGVSNFPEHWLPNRLRYLSSYKGPRKISHMFVMSFGAGLLTCAWLFLNIPLASDEMYGYVGHILICTLMVLALIEHVMLVSPLNFDGLWSWMTGKVLTRES
jgi:putative photosynthetic complex assembly protein 2